MLQSVGHSYAVLSGRRTGDRAAAKKFLEGMHPDERAAKNRAEGKGHARLRSKVKKLGRRLSTRWSLT